MTTSIEWTDQTWNPIVGCSRVSAGCEHCYAERVAHRGMSPQHKGLTVMGKKGPRWTGEVRFLPDRLDEPLSWRKPRRVFVNSMSDLFHDGISHAQRAAICGAMLLAPAHTYQVLTKRPTTALDFVRWVTDRAARSGISPTALMGCAYFSALGVVMGPAEHERVGRLEGRDPFPWWLGVSVEDQATADERIPLLLQCPAAVRWVSYEPALGPIDDWRVWIDGAEASCSRRLSWIVIGGESGPGTRPFDLAWASSTIAQCREAGVPCFVKQLGANVRTRNDDNFTIDEDPPDPDFPGWPLHLEAEGRIEWNPDGPEHYQGAPVRVHLRDRKGGDMSEWRSDLRVRQWPGVQR